MTHELTDSTRIQHNTSDPTKVKAAIAYAALKHQGQTRRDGKTPYISHPMRVLFILANEWGITNTDVLAAAVLHDVIEDTTSDYDEISKRFGIPVANLVAALTKDSRLPFHEREDAYIQQLLDGPAEARLCKLADVFDNLSDSDGLSVVSQSKTISRARMLLAAFSPFEEKWRGCYEACLNLARKMEHRCGERK